MSKPQRLAAALGPSPSSRVLGRSLTHTPFQSPSLPGALSTCVPLTQSLATGLPRGKCKVETGHLGEPREDGAPQPSGSGDEFPGSSPPHCLLPMESQWWDSRNRGPPLCAPLCPARGVPFGNCLVTHRHPSDSSAGLAPGRPRQHVLLRLPGPLYQLPRPSARGPTLSGSFGAPGQKEVQDCGSCPKAGWISPGPGKPHLRQGGKGLGRAGWGWSELASARGSVALVGSAYRGGLGTLSQQPWEMAAKSMKLPACRHLAATAAKPSRESTSVPLGDMNTPGRWCERPGPQ